MNSITYNKDDYRIIGIQNSEGEILEDTGWSFNAVTRTINVPVATPAGTYKVTIRATEGQTNQYTQSTADAVITVIVNKASRSGAVSCNNVTFGSSVTATVSGNTESGTITWGITNGTGKATISTTGVVSPTQAGTVTITATIAETTNYGSYTATSKTITIDKTTGYLTATTTNRTYNGSAQTIGSISTNSGTYYFGLGSSTTGAPSSWGSANTALTATNAGTYYVWVKCDASTNYNAVAAKYVGTVTISQLAVTYTADNQSKTYDGNALSAANTATKTAGTLVSGHTVTFSCSGSQTNAGSSTKTLSSVTIKSGTTDVSSNYSITKVNGTLTVNKAGTSVTLTNASQTYNRSALAIGVSGGSGGTVYYATCATSNGSYTTYTTTKPTLTNVGTLWVKAYVKGDSNHNDSSIVGPNSISISQREVTLSWGTVTWTYNGSAHSTTCTAGNVVSGDTCTVTLTGNSITNAGTTTVTASSLSNSNYKLPSANTKTLTVNKAGGSVSTAPTNKASKYGSGAAVANAGSGTGTMYYALSSSTTTPSSGFSTSMPTVGSNNVGTYYLHYYADASTNYNASGKTYISVTITKADQSAPTVTGGTWTYDGKSHSATATGGGGQGTLTWTNQSRTNAGSQTASAYWSGNSNYNASSSGSATITINQANGYTGASKTDRTYNGSAQVVGSSSGASGTYYLGFGSSTTSAPSSWGSANSSISQTNAGTYYIWAKCDASTNYKAVSQYYVGTATIGKASQSAPTVTGGTWTYNGTTRSATATGGGGQGTLTWTNQSRTNAGSQTASAYWSGNSNYNASPAGSATITINKATGYTGASKTDRTYNGSAQVVGSSSGASGTYYLGFGSSTTSAPSSWGSANSSISQTNAGTYYIWAKCDASTNYNAVTQYYVGTATIGKASSTNVTLTDASQTYNGKALAIGVSGGSGGTVYYATCATSNGTYSSWTTTKPTRTDAGTTYVKSYIKGDSNHNDTSAVGPKSITISKASQSAPTATGYSGKYDGKAHAATATGGGGVGALTWSTTNSRTDVGTTSLYCYWAGNGNYNASSNSNTVSIVISKADQSAPTTIGSPSVSYGSTATGSASGGGGVGSLQYSTDKSNWSTTAPTRTAVGSTTYYARWAGNSNYNASPASAAGTLTVNQANGNISFSPGNKTLTAPGTKLYNYDSVTIDAATTTTSGSSITYGSLVVKNSSGTTLSGWTLSGRTLTAPINTPTGNYTITVTATASATTNYKAASLQKSFTVTISASDVWVRFNNVVPRPNGSDNTYDVDAGPYKYVYAATETTPFTVPEGPAPTKQLYKNNVLTTCYFKGWGNVTKSPNEGAIVLHPGDKTTVEKVRAFCLHAWGSNGRTLSPIYDNDNSSYGSYYTGFNPRV